MCHGDTLGKEKAMNLLKCPECGGDLIVNMRFTTQFGKKLILTDKGWEEVTGNVMNEPPTEPVRSLGAVSCSKCGLEWRRPLYEIGTDNEGTTMFIQLSRDEVKMNAADKVKYFAGKGIKVIYR